MHKPKASTQSRGNTMLYKVSSVDNLTTHDFFYIWKKLQLCYFIVSHYDYHLLQGVYAKWEYVKTHYSYVNRQKIYL